MLAEPLTSPRRRQGRPVESVALTITFKADRETNKKVKEFIPSAVLRNGACEVRIEAKEPAEVAEKAKAVLEKIRTII